MFGFLRSEPKKKKKKKKKKSFWDIFSSDADFGIKLDGNIIHAAKQSKKLKVKSSTKKGKVNKEKLSALEKMKTMLSSVNK